MATSLPPDPVAGRPGPTPPRSEHEDGVLRHVAITSLGCALIAVALQLLVPSLGRFGFLSTLVHSQLIGISIMTLSMVAHRLLLEGSDSRTAFVVANVACAAIGFPIGLLLARLILGLPLSGAPWLEGIDGWTAAGLTTLAASLGFTLHFRSRARLAALAHRAAEDARRAEAARLGMLRAQLDPHMLFNTLANLRALVATDPPRAQRMIDHLVPFLRATLDGSREDVWSLRQEFEELGHYLEIMAIRLGPRLTFETSLPASIPHVDVPALLLQPLVENAVRHGIEPSLSGGRIDVKAERSGDEVVVTVRDRIDAPDACGDASHRPDGPVRAPGARFGLDSVRERLRLFHGDRASLSFDADSDPDRCRRTRVPAASRVIVRLPIRHGATDGTAS